MRDYIASQIGLLLASEDFLNALPGYSREPARTTIVLDRLRALASLGRS